MRGTGLAPSWGLVLAALICQRAMATQPVVRPDPPADPAAYIPCTTDGGSTAYMPLLLQVTVNGSLMRDEFVFLQRPCGTLLARAEDLRKMRIRTEDKPTVRINDAPYLNLNRYDKLRYLLEPESQVLNIEGEPEIFYPTVIDFDAEIATPQAPEPGAFLNYGGFAAGPVGSGDRAISGSAGLGLFGSIGVLTSDWFGTRRGDSQSVRRTATTFTRDFEDQIVTLRLGDVSSRGGAFGTSARIGGVQFGTNFGLRPGMRITPVTLMEAATARNASTYLGSRDLFDPERGSRAAFAAGMSSVPYGPVQLVNMPTYDNGQFVFVLLDSLGNETTVRQDYFFSQGLLRQGLSNFSIEAGGLRNASGGYGGGFGAGTYRYGVSRHLTIEGHVEAAEETQAAGGSVSVSVPYWGVLTATAAGSDSSLASEPGYHGSLGLENRYRTFAYTLRGDCQTAEFLVATATVLPPVSSACRTFGNAFVVLPNYNTIGVSLSSTTFRGLDSTRAARLSYSLQPFRGGQLSMFVAWTDRDDRIGAGLSLSASLGALVPRRRSRPEDLFSSERATMTATASGDDTGTRSGFASISSSARFDTGQMSATAGTSLVDTDRQSLSAGWFGHRSIASAGVARVGDSETWTAGASSALVWMDGTLFRARPLLGSFSAVRLGKENNSVRVNGIYPDSSGDLIATGLLPYYRNTISVNTSDLPLDARLSESRFTVVPRYRSGVLVRPRIRHVRSAIVSILVRDESGKPVPLPVGSYATLPEAPEPFPVGEDGEVYLEGLERKAIVTLHYQLQQCELVVERPDVAPDTIPELGPYMCESIHP